MAAFSGQDPTTVFVTEMLLTSRYSGVPFSPNNHLKRGKNFKSGKKKTNSGSKREIVFISIVPSFFFFFSDGFLCKMSEKSKHNYSAQDDIFSLSQTCLHPRLSDVLTSICIYHNVSPGCFFLIMRLPKRSVSRLLESFPYSTQTFHWKSDTSVSAAVNCSLSPSATRTDNNCQRSH